MKTTDPNNYVELLDVFNIALSVGIIDKFFIINWADEIIKNEDSPNEFIIELSLCGHKDINYVISLINEFVGSNKSSISSRVILAILYHKYKKGQINLQKVTYTINRINWQGELTEIEKKLIYGLDDDFELAHNGIKGSLKEVEKFTLLFLSLYKEFTLENFENWNELNESIVSKIEEFYNSNK